MTFEGTESKGQLDFNDHFSGHAEQYASHRPTYPSALFDYLASESPGREQAWDCATGNGQSAVALASRFERVVATDASGEQLEAASSHERVIYRREAAEETSLPAASCDLVAVAQAVHWFDLDRFYAEVRRVARERGLLAVWTYALMRVGRQVDGLLDSLHDGVVGAYWPDQRRWVDGRYAALPFPFDTLDPPRFEMTCRWTVEQALGYLGTWSAVRRFTADRGLDPLLDLAPRLRAAWGPGDRLVRWPLTLKVGRVA